VEERGRLLSEVFISCLWRKTTNGSVLMKKRRRQPENLLKKRKTYGLNRFKTSGLRGERGSWEERTATQSRTLFLRGSGGKEE